MLRVGKQIIYLLCISSFTICSASELTEQDVRDYVIIISGGYSVGETPVPIPNTAVKPTSADGTSPARDWESRSTPE